MKGALTSVLVANRGEIAVRVIRTARRMGLRTVAVFSEADRGSAHAEMADEALLIGPAPAAESYLRVDRILAAAREAGADCIHPGYGFLSENPDLAEACAAAGIVLVGPPAAAMRALALKDAAKALAEGAGVPVLPGYRGEGQDAAALEARAAEIGYPVLVKAVAGGGGRGMRRVDRPAEFADALASAQREASGAFGDPRVLLERYLPLARHVEIQVLADAHGNIVHLFERDCSLQRRHQKVIEEAPAPGMSPEMRAAMGRAAVDLARAVGYRGVGTVEFIAEAGEDLRPDRFWFMEMNTRLQVEHPVTEAITGLDLVELQFRVVAGEKLPFGQDDLAIRGHAVEARLYAEDPAAGFLPSAGTLRLLDLPEEPGLRVDAGLREGDAVTPYYDPLIAKVIARGATRDEALDRLAAALADTLIAGPRTNLAFLRRLLDAPEMRAGRPDTGLIDRRLVALTVRPRDDAAILAGARALIVARPEPGGPSPWDLGDAFQLGPPRRQGMPLTVDGERVDVELIWPGEGSPRLRLGTVEDAGEGAAHRLVPTEDGVLVVSGGGQVAVARLDPFAADLDHPGGDGVVRAPMHGRLLALLVRPGERVTRGQRLAVVEAMKMEHALLAPIGGEVAEVAAEPGAQVAEGAALITLRAVEDADD